MSHLFSDRVGFIKNAVDSFNRLKVSTPFTLFDNQMRYREGDKFDTANVGASYTTYKPDESVLELTVGTAKGDKITRESKRVFVYQPGKSLLIMNTVVFNAGKPYLRQRVGYFGTKNGVFLEQEGDTLYFVLRSSVTGSVSDARKVPQSQWALDKFDGSGPSGRAVDTTKANILWFDIEWLGVGDVRCGFIVDGEPVTAHVFHNDSVNPTTYMTTAVLPIRYEIENLEATASSSTMKQICSTVISEGGYQGRSINYTTGYGLNNLKALTNAYTVYPILSIRLKQDRLDSVVLPNLVDLFSATNNANFKFQLRLNGTLTGNSFANVSTSSALEVDTAATAISGGTTLNGGYFSPTKGGAIQFGSLEDFNLQLGRTQAGVSDIITVCAETDTAGAGLGAIIGWNELV